MVFNQNQYDVPKTVYFSSEDTSFSSSDSPATIDFNSTLGRNAINGYVKCDGAGDIIVSISEDGSTYGDNIRLKSGETLSLRAISIDSIKITFDSANSSYRVYGE